MMPLKGLRITVAVVALGALLITPAFGQKETSNSLARYVPSDGLSILLEHDGLHSQPKVWEASATYKMLNETKLGIMLEDILTQLIDHGLRSVPQPPLKGKEIVGLVEHLIDKGFAIGYCGPLNAPTPKAAVVVIRDANKSDTFKKLMKMIPQAQEPAAKQIDAPGGRKVWTMEGAPVRWWFEKDDFVFSFAPPGAPDPVVAVLEGTAPSALKSPLRNTLWKGTSSDYTPIGVLFVDLSTLPQLPPQAVQLGLDGVKAVEASWGLQGKATVTMIGIQAPKPRRGIIALFDQPAIGTATRYTPADGGNDYTVMSIEPGKFVDGIFALMKQADANSAANAQKFAAEFERRTQVNLRKDLLGKVGPRIAFSSGGGLGLSNIFGMWFHPPDFGIVAELKDPEAFQATLDKLIASLNRELRSAGAMVPPQPGQPVRKGTAYAEFRKLPAPDNGYILSIPPSVLTLPSGFRPTVMIDAKRNLIALGGTAKSAAKALTSLDLNAKGGEPIAEKDAVVFSKSDQAQILPELLTNVPAIVQFFGFAAAQPGPGRPGGPPFRLEMDPDSIPDPDSMRKFMFPSTYTMSVDNDSIRFTGYQPFPLAIPQISGGMEAPVLVALLLPAVQAAREAARRAQCVNNLKQIGLAMHNHHAALDGLPPRAITNAAGKPLLSWRVAILPYIEQQALYEKFKLDEPWDSPHNSELIKYMPQIYMCPSRTGDAKDGQTNYQAFAGEGALFDSRRKVSFARVTDGLSNTLMVVEASTPVTWTKPDDLPFDAAAANPAKPLFGAGSSHAGGFNALMGDGSVRFIKSLVSPQVMRALITRAGGEILGADSF